MKFTYFTRLLLPLLSAALISGCLDSNSKSGGDDTSIGRVNYHGISGLNYQTASQSGITEEPGTFHYYPGETLTLRVGDLLLTDSVPAAEFITFLEFFPETRGSLQQSGVDDEQLTDHWLKEQQLIDNTTILNLTRFLLALNWTIGIEADEGIDIRARVIEQLNLALSSPDLPDTVDFTVNQQDFTASDSPANQLLASICFYPEDNVRCSEPPTQAEIDSAPLRPSNEADIDPDILYSEDLESLKDSIESSVRSLDSIDDDQARAYLSRELRDITRDISRRYRVSPQTLKHSPSDRGIHNLDILKIDGNAELASLEAISTRPSDVYIHSKSWQSATVDYVVEGDSGVESELIINFQPENTYRWVRKSVRVVID